MIMMNNVRGCGRKKKEKRKRMKKTGEIETEGGLYRVL